MIPDQKLFAARLLGRLTPDDDEEWDKICVRDLVLPARIGVWSEEKNISQNVRVCVDLFVKPEMAVTDDLNTVISYDFVVDGIKAILNQGHILLVETLAERIASHCLSEPRALKVRVRVEKIERIPGASLGCEIIRRRAAYEAE